MTDVSSPWRILSLNWYSCSRLDSWKRRQHHQWHYIEGWRWVFPRNRSNAPQRRPTPSLDPSSALHRTHFKNLVIHSKTMMGCTPTATKPHPFCPSGIHHHVHVVGKRCLRHRTRTLNSRPSSRTCLPISRIPCGHLCTWQALGRKVRHTLHQPCYCRVLAGYVAIEFTLHSEQMYSEQALEQCHTIFCRAIALRLMGKEEEKGERFDWDGAKPRDASSSPP